MDKFNQLSEEYTRPMLLVLNLLDKSSILVFVSSKSWFRNRMCPLFIKTCVFIYLVSQTVYLSRLFRGEMELYELAYIFPVYVVCIQAVLKAMNVVSKIAEIRFLVLELGGIWRNANLSEVQTEKKSECINKLNLCYKAFYWMTMIGSWQYMMAPLFEIILRKYILGQECTMLLPFACSFPFSIERNWIAYTFAYVFEVYSMLGIVYYYVGTEMLLITLAAQLSMEFILLQEDFLHAETVVNPNNVDDIDIRELPPVYGIKDMIKRHQKLIKLAEQLDDIFNNMIFINLSSTSVIIGFFALAAKVARGTLDMVNNFLAVLTLLLPLFNLCYFGELLRQSSGGIADSAYNGMWYKGDKNYKKMICFVIGRAHKPCSLTSLKYSPIALCTFTAVLSTTWSYFSLASSVIEDTN